MGKSREQQNLNDRKYFGPPIQVDRKVCEATGKVMYTSKHEARKALVGQMGSKSIRAYNCNECHRLHVTKDWKNKRNN